ncbi:MAG: P-loop NTPase [Phycisphaerales bacterium]
MAITRQAVLDVLSGIALPSGEGDLVSSGQVKGCVIDGTTVTLMVNAGALDAGAKERLRRTIEGAVRSGVPGVGEVRIEFAAPAQPAAAGHAPISGPRGPLVGGAGGGGAQGSAPVLPNVKHIVAVGAGKGGVGKSTVAVNLAVGLALRGHAVGLLDGDIYGPSLPTMLGLEGLEANLLGNMLQPFYVHGVKAMTIGKLVDPEKPLIWRGPMAHGAFKQLVEQTEWGPLDYLIIDLPPGTGDVALTMAQSLKLAGAVVVCTPQKVAQDDAVRRPPHVPTAQRRGARRRREHELLPRRRHQPAARVRPLRPRRGAAHGPAHGRAVPWERAGHDLAAEEQRRGEPVGELQGKRRTAQGA